MVCSFRLISAWIEDKYIKNYAEYKEELVKSSKSAAFKEAVQKIDEFISDPIVSLFFFVAFIKPFAQTMC